MLSISPEAEVVGPLDILVGTLKQRDVSLEKVPCLGVGNCVGIKFVVFRVESIDMVPELLRAKHGRLGRVGHSGQQQGRDDLKDHGDKNRTAIRFHGCAAWHGLPARENTAKMAVPH